MKYLRLALVAFAFPLGLAYAQDDEQRRAPPVEIPDFSNLDEYIYEPKSTLTFGVRYLSGAKVAFGGSTGRISSLNAPGADTTSTDTARLYQDGAVQPDARTVGRVDEQGQPVINPDTGLQYFDRIPADGRTNTWNYTDLSQRSREGFVAFRDYSAEILGATARGEDGNSTLGMDIAMHRDMGKVFGTRMAWTLTAGVSINDLSSSTSGGVRARINTLTDYYKFYEVNNSPLPNPPYSAPSQITETITDAEGNPTVIEGVTQVRVVDTTVLLDATPAERTEISTIDETTVTNRWKLKGAYYTFRAGPTIWIPIGSRIRASVSVGAALIYSGATYTVTETLTPDVGAEISETEFSEEYKLLPGYYADATLQFDLTERAGFYAGAVYQSAGSYTQMVENATTSYSTKVDFKNLNGVRAGMSIRF